MSIKAMTWAFELPLEPRAKITLLAIADNARDDGVAWPSRDLIALKSSQSRATVGRRLRILSDLGVLGVHERFREDGSQTTDEIRLDLTLTASEVMRRMQSLNPDSKGESAEDAADDAATSESEGGYQPATPPSHMSNPGDADVTRGGLHCGNPQDEPSVEPISPPSPPPGGLGPLAKPDKQANEKRDALWRKFLGVYPSISAMDQQLAKSEFDQLSVDDADWAFVAAPAYAAECRKIGKPPKNAHLWLRKAMFRNFPRTGGASSSISPGSYSRDSMEAKAIKVLYDLAGAMDFFVKYVRKGDQVYYRHAVTPQLLKLADAGPREQWPIATRNQAGSWNSLLDKYPTIERKKRIVEGDHVPFAWAPKTDGSLSPATGPPETYMSEQDLAEDFK